MSGCGGDDGNVNGPCALIDLMSSNVSYSSPGRFESLAVQFHGYSERMLL